MIVLRIDVVILSDKLELAFVIKKRFIMIFTKRKIIKKTKEGNNKLIINFLFLILMG
jgi:hypothetical protein